MKRADSEPKGPSILTTQGAIMFSNFYPPHRSHNHGYPCGYPYCYPYGPSYSSYNLLNSQHSSVNQALYNYGFMNGVSQSSVVNQVGSPFWPRF